MEELFAPLSNEQIWRIKDKLFSLLYDNGSGDQSISAALEYVGGITRADRVYIFGNSDDAVTTSNLFEWCAEGIEPMIDKLQNVDIAENFDLYGMSDEKGTIYIITEEEENPHLKDILEMQGIKCLVLTVVSDNGKPVGFAGFDFCREAPHFDESYIGLMRFCARMVAVFVLKQRATWRARAEQLEKSAVMDRLSIPVYIVDDERRLRYFNKSTRVYFPEVKTGDHCYEHFMGCEGVCELCPIKNLSDENETATRSLTNRRDVTVIATASRITWSGKPMHLITAQDITRLLRDHEQRYRDAYLNEIVPGGMMGGYMEPGFPIYFINDAMLRHLGYDSREEFARATNGLIENCIHPDDREYVSAELARQFAHGDGYRVVYRMLKKDGSFIWTDDAGKIMTAVDGRRAITSVCIDITDLVQARHSAETANKQLDRIINSIPGGVVILRLAEHIELEYYSKGVLDMCGLTREEYESTARTRGEDLIDDTDGAKRETVRRLAENGDFIDIEFRHYHKSGVPVWIRAVGWQIDEREGDPVIQLVFHNITEQKQAEFALRLEQQRTNLMLRSTRAGFWEYDVAAHRLALSMPGEKKSEVFRSPRDLIAQGAPLHSSAEQFNQMLEAVRRGEPEFEVSLKAEGVGGATPWWRVRGRTICEGGKPVYAVGSIIDVTEEMRLAARGRQMELAIGTTKLILWCYDLQSGVASVNSGDKVLNFEMPRNSPDTLLERGLVMPESVEDFKDFIEKLRRGEDVANLTVHFKPVDGLREWQRISCATIFDEKGRPAVTTGVCEDVSDYERARENYQEELRAVENVRAGKLLCKFRVNISQDCVCEYESFSDEVAVPMAETFSASMREVCRLCADESESAYIGEVMSVEHLTERFRAGENSFSYEYRRRMKNGAEQWVQTRVRLFREPGTGDIVGFCHISDINEEKTANAALSAALVSSYACVCLADKSTGKLSLLAASSLSTTPVLSEYYEENMILLAEHLREYFIAQEDYHVVRDELTFAKLEEKMLNGIYSVSIHIRRSDNGETAIFKFQFEYIDACKTHILITASDMTDMMKTELARQQTLEHALDIARRASDAKTQFLAHMSHDMRTPLNAVLGMAEVAAHKTTREEMLECIDVINTSGRFLLSLINDILDVSKSESNGMTLHPEPYQLPEFKKIIDASIKPLLSSRDIEFKEEMLCGLECIYVDKTRINQLFNNLLSNAAKYTPRGGSVLFRAELLREEEGIHWVRFTVSDTGIGMSEEFLQKAFEPFTRERMDIDEQWQGTGLGLAITKRIVDAMGGEIRVESKKDEGTTFIVDLPLVPLSPGPAAQPERTVWERDALSGMRVLIAEDNRINLLVAVNMLKYAGVEVTQAHDGLECMEKFKESPEGYFDAVLLDIRMPRMDGLETARAIRALDRADAERVAVIAMTANAFSEDERLSIEAGMDAHLNKPFESAQLYSLLEQHVIK